MIEFWLGWVLGFAEGMFVMWGLSVVARRRRGSQDVQVLPPRGGSVMSRPTVGPKGGTGVPPKWADGLHVFVYPPKNDGTC